jgi:hypothetical protein
MCLYHFFLLTAVLLFKLFVLINHSRTAYLEAFHGRAVRLLRDSLRLPFYGAFLIHEMRVRGRWPLIDNREIPCPIPWQEWISNNGSSDVDDSPSHTCNVPATGYTMTMTNPFDNPAELEALKRSWAEQPDWKAAVIEGESWEGSVEENTVKWRSLVGPSQGK